MNIFEKLRRELDEAITYGRFNIAGRLIREGLKEAGDQELLGELEYFKGQACILEEDFFSAIEHFDRAVKYNPNDGASFNDRALCMVELGIIDDAFSYFDRGIEVEPDYSTIHHNKGWLLNKIGRHTEAIKCFNRALELEPGRAVTYENLGDALTNQGKYKDALWAYTKAIQLLKPGYSNIKKQLISSIKQIEKELNKK
jgi:tetratricopeptide (TPR) repeat protein